MSDIEQDTKGYMVNGGGRHRCTIKPKRRGRPRLGDRGDCVCGIEYVWAGERFPQWTPAAITDDPISVVRRGRSVGPRLQ